MMILKIALAVLIIWVALKVIKFLAKRIILIILIIVVLYGITEAKTVIITNQIQTEITK